MAGLSQAKRAPVLHLCESLSEVMFKFTNIVMYFAPIGVGAAMAFTVGNMGLGVLVNLGKLLLTFYGALIAFALLVLLPVAADRRVPIRRFLRRGRRAGDHRVRHLHQRGRAAPRDGGDGSARRAAPHRRVRHSRRLQLQPRWFDAVSRAGQHLRRAGRGRPHALGASSS